MKLPRLPGSLAPMRQPDHLRCGDEDRRVVEKVLSTAYADGRLSLDEHDERLTAVWQAKTFGELRPIIDDLVTPEQHARQALAASVPDGRPRAVVDTVGAQPESDRITAILGSHKRLDSPWRFREYTNITTVMGDAKLDLRQATFEAMTSEINVMIIMGEVTLIVPAGVRVRDETSSVMAEVTMKGLAPEESGPEIVLRGAVIMGEIKVQGPDHKTWRKKMLG